MFTTFRGAALSAIVLAAGVLPALAAPAQAATPECSSAVTLTEYNSSNGVTYSTRKGSHLGSTTCWMARGSSSAGVSALQKTLIECYDQRIAVDGSFGPATQQALKNAQAATNRSAGRTVITVDGSYGPQSRYWLFFHGTGSDGSRFCSGPLGTWGGI